MIDRDSGKASAKISPDGQLALDRRQPILTLIKFSR